MKKIGGLLLFVLFFSSCEKEKNDTEPTLDNFVGVWNCVETSSLNGGASFEVHINKSTTVSSQINIENFYNYGFSFIAYAEVNAASTEFVIPAQIIQGNTVSGSGMLVGTETINMSYTVDNGSDIDYVTASLTKQ